MNYILYIEDDPSLRQLVQFMLNNRESVTLLEAETGKGGLQVAFERLPQIILLDLSLPDISGYDVLKELQNSEATRGIPVVAVSGNSLPEDIEQGMQAGFLDYLTKPIRVSEFYALLDRLL